MANEDWLSDEIRARSAIFWARGKAGHWPVEVQGNVFLATAILEVGAALFDDWTGNEPLQWFLPALDGSRPYVADGFDAAFAGSLLAQHRPEMFARVCERKSSILTDEEWLAASEIYRGHVQTPRALATQKMIAIHKRMTVALADSKLVSVTRTDGSFKPIPPAHWIDESVAYARFLESQMDPARPNIQNWPSIQQVPPFSDRTTLVLGNDWIFVTRDSLDQFKREIVMAVHPGSSRRETKPFSGSDMRRAFNTFMATHPSAGREAWVKEAQRQFPGSSKNAARSIWKDATPAEGRRAGRKTTH